MDEQAASRTLSRDKLTVYATWALLLLVPLIVMGWAVGRVGPASDDWRMLENMRHGRFIDGDCTCDIRPLGFLPYLILNTISGIDVNSFLWFSFVLEGISAILLFEVMRRVLIPCVGRGAWFGAFAASLIYVLYPSNVTHYWIVMMHDPFIRVLLLSGLLLWVHAASTDRVVYVIVGTALMIVNLLQKENSTFVYALMPAVLLYYRKSLLSKRWRWVTLAWYAALGAYLLWRLVIVPRIPHVGPVVTDYYAPSVTVTIPGMIAYFAQGMEGILLGAFRVAFTTDLQTLHRAGSDWVTPVALAAAAAVLGVALFLSRARTAEEVPQFELRNWAVLLAGSAAAALAGLAPYYASGQTYDPNGIVSRYSTTALIGASMFLALLGLLPMVGLARNPGARIRTAAGTALTLALTAVLVAAGVIRQTGSGYDWIDTWNVQRAFWQRVVSLGVTYKPGTVILVNGLPRTIHGLPLGYASWGYEPAFRLLFKDFPEDISVFNTGPGNQWQVRDDGIQMGLPGPHPLYPYEHLMVLYFDAKDQSVEVSPRLPPEMTEKPVFVYSGTNPPEPPTLPSDLSRTLLGPPIEPGGCIARVPVFTSDAAPSDGDIIAAAYPSGEVLDRRAVANNASLDYSFASPCSTWVRVYFQARASAVDSQILWLVSQYGDQAEYGTAETPENVTYDTSFAEGKWLDIAALTLH